MGREALLLLAAVALLGGPAAVAIVASSSERKRAAELLPQVASAFEALRADLEARGIRTFLGSTHRSDAQQEGLVETGASSTTNSWHKLRRAGDLYVYGPDGKLDLQGVHVERYRTMHERAKLYGFRGLAFHADGTKRYITTKTGRKWDAAHLEFPEGMTFAQALEQHRNRELA